MAKRRLTTDQVDFIDMLGGVDSRLAVWALNKAQTLDPRDMATLLEYYARCAREWCAGRYGSPAQ